MRVLQVLTDDDRRGAQVFAVELGERLSALGLDVTTVGLRRGAVGGLDVNVLGTGSLAASTLRQLRRAMAEADVTAAHGSTTLAACSIAGLGPGRPFVYRQISDPVFWTPTLAKRIRTRAFYRCARHVVALSPITASIVHDRFGVPVDRITVIPNAVDERRCTPATPPQRAAARQRLGLPGPPAPVVAYVGALTPEKGVEDLIDAITPGQHLVVAGDGPALASFRDRAAQAGASCTFVGRVDDPWDVYAAADLVVLPSRGGDTQPAVLIESALVGTPCVATPVGAISDIVRDHETGRLVPPGDIPALRAVLDELVTDASQRQALATAAMAHATQSFSMSVVASQWSTVLHHVVSSRSA